MTIKENIRGRINRVAETHFFIKPVLISALKRQIITPDGQRMVNGAKTYHEFWVNSLNENFYDMGTLIRLGTEIELGLKYFYMQRKGHLNLVALEQDPNYQMNIFQRLMPWTNNNTIDLYKSQIHYELTSNTKLKDMQELMLYRHLYAHNAGLLNDKFIFDFHRLTQKNISNFSSASTFPQEDTYFFEPLKRLNQFIEDAREFFFEFP